MRPIADSITKKAYSLRSFRTQSAVTGNEAEWVAVSF
jgi:hypothetical protein